MQNKLPSDRIAAIVSEAVVIEKEFVCDALPVDLIGMNGRLMGQVRTEGGGGGSSTGVGVAGVGVGCGGGGRQTGARAARLLPFAAPHLAAPTPRRHPSRTPPVH